ncbi:helix-turn-helix domain-containing protein [Dactylosporangium sp. NPDC051541]|uniref:helix-turn-helix domain-containing protein n=1 Tax=Dactylosporangium sp. NPDC051541 TaxID=3363977 RepID=UPI0037B368AF
MAVDASSELAQRLTTLKEATGCSYTELAARAALSRSSVHRYCSGTGVPPDFDTVSRLARACGAGRGELLDLHRMWVLATTRPAPGKPPEPALVPAPAPPPAADRPPPSRRRWNRRLPDRAAVAIFALFGLLVLNALSGSGPPRGGGAATELKAAACAAVVGLGEHGECVREIQVLLIQSGTSLTVDANFSTETRRRVIAFQVLAGLPPTGRVDDATRKALVSGRISMRTWSEERIERRIREVFRNPTAGDEAVHVARCRSHLDALWVGPDPDGGWGVFQLSDEVLGRYDGTQRVALDPEWNIQAAHWIWAEHRDFRAWPVCVSTSPTTPSTPRTAQRAPGHLRAGGHQHRPPSTPRAKRQRL